MAGGEGAAAEARVHRALSHVARVRMVRLLEERPHSVRQLATATGLHANTVRSHLDVLIRAGLAVGQREGPSRPGRPSILYRLADPPRDSDAHESLARVLAEALSSVTADPSRAAEQAAQPWGRARVAGRKVASPAEAVQLVVSELEDLGFAPELQTDDETGRVNVLLRRCPFDDMARAYGDVVCSAHLGLIRGALQEVGADVVADLAPFVEPTACLTTLTVLPPQSPPRD